MLFLRLGICTVSVIYILLAQFLARKGLSIEADATQYNVTYRKPTPKFPFELLESDPLADA
jgi:hypothetical protein